ncbi:hypothetical protein [Devosia sp.]|uniref:hypothetical protein n=1 Tax=Devosia sp. TaxID=1871048 RepID=UPI003BA8B9FB
MKLKFLIGMLGIAAMLAPMLSFAETAPLPLPRRADRMPQAISATADPAAEAPPAAEPDALAEAPPAAETPAVAATEAIAAIPADPQPVTLVAKITDSGGDIPEGVVWRVFETKTDASGNLALAAKSEDAEAHLSLVPGNYVVHVAYGRAQTTDTITVGEGDNTKALVIDAGGLRLNAAVTGDVAIPINLLRFDIYTAGSEADRVLVAQNVSPSDIVTLNSGTYHVISYFGDVNAVVRADLRVEPGQLTDATLYHKASQISFKLVSEAGGEAIADIDWTVKTADGQTVFTNTGAFPSTVLAEGDYLVFAKQGEKVYNRQFQVIAGASKEIEVLTTVY